MLRLFIFFLFLAFVSSCTKQQKYAIVSTPKENITSLNLQQPYWFSSVSKINKANEWLTVIEASDSLGLFFNKDIIDGVRLSIKSINLSDSVQVNKIDKQITEVVLLFIKYLQQGNIKLEYDEVSENRDSLYVNLLLKLDSIESVEKIISILDCKDPDYLLLKRFLNDSIAVIADSIKYKSIILAMNYRRYISFNRQQEYVVVNIPSAEAYYYRHDSLILNMRTVVGKKTTPSRVFASYIKIIETYPYWNVPRSIAVNEILPKINNDSAYLMKNNFEVVDGNGSIVQSSKLRWEEYNSDYFPYRFRQVPGQKNSLGVLKFVLNNPFSIYLHDTNYKGAFAKENRFISHGCIRLEKPFDLAYEILRGNINLEELKNEKKGMKPTYIKLEHPIPTFVIYMPVTIVNGRVTFFNDIYNLVK